MTSQKIFILLLCATTVTNLALYGAEPTLPHQKNSALSALKLAGSGVIITTAGIGLGIANYMAKEVRCTDQNYTLYAPECNNENSEEDILKITAPLVYCGGCMAVAGTTWLAWEGLKTASSYSWKAYKAVDQLTSRAFYTTTKNACYPARTQRTIED